MSDYAALNLILVVVAVVASRLLRVRRRDAVRALKISVLIPFLGFPWDFFGIHHRAWGHGDPGPTLLGVPLNEMLLAFLMSYTTAVVLLCNRVTIFEEARRQADAEDCGDCRS